MKITAVTRFKHGGVLGIMRQLGWTVKLMAVECGVSKHTISCILNLRHKPNKFTALAIQGAFERHGVHFDPKEEWPEWFKRVPSGFFIEQTQEFSGSELRDATDYYKQIESVSGEAVEKECDILALLPKLDSRKRAIIECRFGMNGNSIHSLKKVGELLGVSQERVRQLEHKAIREMRKAYFATEEYQAST